MQNRLSGGSEIYILEKMGFVVRVKVFRRFVISIFTTTLDLNLLHWMAAKIDLANKVQP